MVIMKLVFKESRSERGAALVLMALLLPLLIGLLGLAIDVGLLFMHHSRLQHAADAMALAGVRVNSPAKASSLISLSDVEETEGSLSFRNDEKDYVLTRKTSATDEDRKAGDMLALDTNAMDANRVEFASSLFDGDGAKAYKVTLTETFATSFLKVFGVTEYPVEVRALAVVTQGSTKQEVLEVVKSIFDISPNYYWEDMGKKENESNHKFNFVDFTINEDDPETFTIDAKPEIRETKKMFSLEYFNANVENRKDYLMAIPYLEITQGKPIASYKDRETDPDGPPAHEVKADYKYCAAPIEALPRDSTEKAKKDLTDALNGLYGIEWPLNNNLIDTFFSYAEKNPLNKSGAKLQTLYVDRPNIRGGGLNPIWRTVDNKTTNSARIRATVLTITDDNWGTRVASPLHVRFESEPVRVGGSENVTVVQPITINVTGKNPTPMIIAYEGPSRLRGETFVPGTEIMEDVPYVNFNEPTKIQPPTMTYFNSDSTLKADNKYLRMTSVTESPPVTINLESDFRGVIYIPFSKAIIKGSGKIEGFILAHELEFVGSSDSGRTRETLRDFVLPVLMPERRNASNTSWDYRTISEQPMDYQIVYNKFTNYMEAEN